MHIGALSAPSAVICDYVHLLECSLRSTPVVAKRVPLAHGNLAEHFKLKISYNVKDRG